MKILFFSPYYYPYTSGITTYPQKILFHLAKKNEIRVLTFKFKKNLKDKEKFDNYQICRINYLFKISKGFISPQSLIYFYNYVKKSNLIILNQPNFEGLFLALLGKIFHKKIISIFHCQVFLTNKLWNNIINFCLNLSIKIQLFFSDKIVAYTEDYFASISELGQFKNKTVFTLPPIEDRKSNKPFFEKLKKLKNNDVLIGYSGRIAEEKGLEYLIKAVTPEGWPNGLPTGKIKLIFAGPYGKDVAGENNYYKKIVKMLKEKKIQYKFLGNLSEKNLCAFYKAIDLLILPSINQTEAFGMVQAEAMLAGTPVIASNLPGVRIPITLTKMGKIVESKNPEKIKQAVLEVLKNKNEFANDNLVKNAKEIFDVNKVYRFYENLINNEV